MAKPLVISAFEGTYKDSLRDSSKYNITIYKGYGNSAKGFVNSIKDTVKQALADVIIVPAALDVQKELFNEGIDFAGIYPANNACGVFQDRLDDLGYSEDAVCSMIETWKERVINHSWRQLAKKNIIVSDDQYIDDSLIESLM